MGSLDGVCRSDGSLYMFVIVLLRSHSIILGPTCPHEHQITSGSRKRWATAGPAG